MRECLGEKERRENRAEMKWRREEESRESRGIGTLCKPIVSYHPNCRSMSDDKGKGKGKGQGKERGET